MRYHSIWISDIHLGTKHSRVDRLLEFLKENESEYIYIVGDFIDGWELRRRWFWTEEHNVLIQKLLRKHRKDTQIICITGNHDEFLERFVGLSFGGMRIAREAIHHGLDGRRYLVVHGHQFDGLTQCNRLLEKLGAVAYDWILTLNHYFNRVRRRLGFGYWSFASYLKMKSKSAVKFITHYEEAMAQMARKRNVHGIICGHIHRAERKMIGELEYLNCGDWVESCTALVEDFEGRFQILNLHENSLCHTE